MSASFLSFLIKVPDAQHSSLEQLADGRRGCDREMMEIESLQGLEACIEMQCPNVSKGVGECSLSVPEC